MNKKKLLAGVAAAALLLPAGLHADSEGDRALHDALELLKTNISRAETELRSFDFYATDQDRAGAYLHLSRMLIKALEEQVIQDPDYPFFRVLDFRIREGGDNPDQRYLFSRIRGGETYRLWGKRGSATRVEFQLYAGEPWAGTGKVAGFLDFDDLKLGADGSFEVYISSTRQGDNWLPTDKDANALIVRQIYAEWNAADPGAVHIDKVSTLGTRKPPADSAGVAARLRNAAATLYQSTTVWPHFVKKRYLDKMPANTMSPLTDPGQVGGVNGRWMANGHFALQPDQALIIKTWPTAAAYQGIQLTDLWFASLEYADQISSLSTRQAVLAPDGAYYFVIAGSDPHYHNWLDSGGLPRGVFLLRFDGARGAIAREQWPSAQLVALRDLPKHIPGWDQGLVTSRAATLQERRRHVQVRFGN